MTTATEPNTTPTPAAPTLTFPLHHDPRLAAIGRIEDCIDSLEQVSLLLSYAGASLDPIEPTALLLLCDNLDAIAAKLNKTWTALVAYRRDLTAAAPPVGGELSDLHAYRALLKTAAAGVLEMLDRAEAAGAG